MLPYLTEVQSASKKYSVMFKGINYGEGTLDGEFAETYNLSTDQYPCITQRAARVIAAKYNRPSTLHAKGHLLVIDERLDEEGKPTGFADVFYGDNPDPIGEVAPGKKQTATIGNYIVIFPDKKYYKVPTEDENGVMQDGEFGSMDEEYKAKELKFTKSSIISKENYNYHWLEFGENTISICKEFNFICAKTTNLSGDKGQIIMAEQTGKGFPFKVGEYISLSGHSKYNDFENVSIYAKPNPYTINVNTNLVNLGVETNVTITRNVAGFPFKAGDRLVVSGCGTEENNKEVLVESVSDDKITLTVSGDDVFTPVVDYGDMVFTMPERKFPFEKGDAVTITGCSNAGNNKEKEIIIKGVSDDKLELTFDDNAFTKVDNEESEVTISRTVPDLEFICESNYRLWGTKGNTIYSSKFSDPFNFQVFEGLASDSYAIEVGSEGEFTGCIPYSSHICFFKENTLHKLYGTKPSNFQITTVNVYGVQSGSEKSMQIVNEQLLYKGVGGVYAYTGGVPELISEKFGNNRYSDAVACCDGEKYYISMKQGDTYDMFAYDVLKNIWLREDDTQAVDMTFYDGKVYFIDGRGCLYYIDKSVDRGDIEWGATFCTMHETINERKGYSKFHLRMDLSAGAWLAVDIKTDNELAWRQVYATHNEKAKTVSIPIIPTRCDSIDIRLRGKGGCTIKAFIREFTVGSDV